MLVLAVLLGLHMQRVAGLERDAKKAGNSAQVPNVILVKVKPSQKTQLQSTSAATETGVASIDQKFERKHKRIASQKIVRPGRHAKLNTDLARWTKITVKNPGKPTTDGQGSTYYPEVDALIRELAADPNVEQVQKDVAVSLAYTPNDPYYFSSGSIGPGVDDLWGLKAIHASTAWDTTKGASVTVGIVDSGVDFTHPDLAANAWVNPGEVAGNGVDDDGNGYIDDIHGWNFRGNNNDLTDVIYHGSHVAGTVAATGDNNQGVVGVAFNARLMALRACDADRKCYLSSAAQGIQYAVNMGAKVTNNSYGGPGANSNSDSLYNDALEYAHNSNVTTVVAAGNDAKDIISDSSYPAADSRVITVGAVDETLAPASFTDYGDRLDVMAPGEPILSTVPTAHGCGPSFTTIYCYASGTSMASPHVAGIVALMYAVNPNIKPEEVRQVLRTTAQDLGASGFDSNNGFGLAMADASVARAAAPNVLTPFIASPRFGNMVAGDVAVTGSIGGSNVSSYKLEIGSGEYPSSWTQLASGTGAVPTTQTLATFNSRLYAYGYYTLRLTATNSSNQSFNHKLYKVLIANPNDTTAPAAPSNLGATPNATSIMLNWTASTDNYGVTGYIVKRNGVTIGTPSTSSFTDTGLTPGTTYAYSIQAYDAAANTSTAVTGSFATLADTTAPSTVSSLNVSGRTTHTITLSWAAATDNVGVTGYAIYRNGTQVATTASTSWTDSGRALATTYSYGVEAYDAAVNHSSRSNIDAATLADTTAPTVTIAAPVSGTFSRSVAVTVNASDDEGVSNVKVYRDTTLVATLTTKPYATTVNIIGLTDGAHTIKAVAADASGNTAQQSVTITVENPRRGDLTGDNAVNVFDLSALLSKWNQTAPAQDLDGNNVVNIFDLSILLYEYGK